jgi:hypothetical protein
VRLASGGKTVLVSPDVAALLTPRTGEHVGELSRDRQPAGLAQLPDRREPSERAAAEGVDHPVDKGDIAEEVDVDLVVADVPGSAMRPGSLEELALVDATSVGQRADEVVAEMFAVPVDIGFGECAEVARIQNMERCDRLRLLEGSLDLPPRDGCFSIDNVSRSGRSPCGWRCISGGFFSSAPSSSAPRRRPPRSATTPSAGRPWGLQSIVRRYVSVLSSPKVFVPCTTIVC